MGWVLTANARASAVFPDDPGVGDACCSDFAKPLRWGLMVGGEGVGGLLAAKADALLLALQPE